MQTLKTRNLQNLRKIFLNNSRYQFSSQPFEDCFSKYPLKNAIRFENQNRIWTFQELHKHSHAFGYGLVEQGYQPGDKLLLWVEKNSNAEVVATQIGAAAAGVTVVPTYARSQEELEQALEQSGATGILYSPNSQLGEEKYCDVVLRAIPELESQGNLGREFRSDRFPNLKYVVHTGFYTQPGQYKYRDVLVYASQNFNTLSLPSFNATGSFYSIGGKTLSFNDLQNKTDSLRQQHNISDNTTVFIAGDAKNEVALALGALNSILYGNYVVYTGKADLNKIGQYTQHYEDFALVLDGSVAEGVQQLNWDQKILDSLKSVALVGENAQESQSLFQGVNTQVY